MSTPLLVRPTPLVGEGVRGYMLRLSEANGLAPQRDLFGKFFSGSSLSDVTHDSLSMAAEFIGIPCESLTHLGYAKDSSCIVIGGQYVAFDHFRRSQAAICPQCLKQTDALRASWDLSAQVACADHACWLIDQCPRCREPIDWLRPGVRTCQCGFDLSTAQATPAPANVLALTRELDERFTNGVRSFPGADHGFPAELYNTPLNELLGWFQIFSREAFASVRGGEVPTLHASPKLRDQIIGMRALTQALTSWPVQWQSMLEHVYSLTMPSALRADVVGILSGSEARAPFKIVLRQQKALSAQVPDYLRTTTAEFLSARAFSLGMQVFYKSSLLKRSKSDEPALRAPSLKGLHELAECDFWSRSAVKHLLNVSETDLADIDHLIGRRRRVSWIPVKRIDGFLARLHDRVEPMPRKTESVRIVHSKQLKDALEKVLSGQMPCYTHKHATSWHMHDLSIPIRLGPNS